MNNKRRFNWVLLILSLPFAIIHLPKGIKHNRSGQWGIAIIKKDNDVVITV